MNLMKHALSCIPMLKFKMTVFLQFSPLYFLVEIVKSSIIIVKELSSYAIKEMKHIPIKKKKRKEKEKEKKHINGVPLMTFFYIDSIIVSIIKNYTT